MGSRAAASVVIMKHVTASECGQTQIKSNSDWTTMQDLCSRYSLDSDADASVDIVLAKNQIELKTTPVSRDTSR